MTDHRMCELKSRRGNVVARSFNTFLRAVAFRNQFWEPGQLFRVRFMGGTPDQHAMFMLAALEWESKVKVSFVESTDADAELRVAFDPSLGAWSYLGNDAKTIPLNEATINLGWDELSTYLHEIGHALGLRHAHQSPKAGIVWNRDVVIMYLSSSPNFWSLAQIENNVFNVATGADATEFDPASIMLYSFHPEWVDNEQDLGWDTEHKNVAISATDANYLAGHYGYPEEVPEEPPIKEDPPIVVVPPIDTEDGDDEGPVVTPDPPVTPPTPTDPDKPIVIETEDKKPKYWLYAAVAMIIAGIVLGFTLL